MPLHPTSRFENVVASLGAAVRAALDASGGGAWAVHYPGDGFDPGGIAEWFEMRAEPGPSRFHRQVAPGLLGATETVVLRLDAKVRCDGTTDAHRVWEMADAAAEAFPIGRAVAFKDYAGSAPPYDDLGSLKVVALDRSDRGEAEGIAVARSEVRLQYLRSFAP
ncbi:MAG: hypothetical protein KC466_18560 [Myxococcales bacterium]|nr:hypothetical protein [Myxococcales bacterium]